MWKAITLVLVPVLVLVGSAVWRGVEERRRIAVEVQQGEAQAVNLRLTKQPWQPPSAEEFLGKPTSPPPEALLIPQPRVEVVPPTSPAGYEPGRKFQVGAEEWTYVGGNQTLRAAWRVVNAEGLAILPRPPAGRDAETLYTVKHWQDALGWQWTYTGEMDAAGNPLVAHLDNFGKMIPQDTRPVRRAEAAK